MEDLSRILYDLLHTTADEKTTMAEVSTPYSLREEMLNSVPAEFWTAPRRVLDPCVGKGGFVLSVYNRFWRGLAATIPDERERHRAIIEECLFFMDLNGMNVLMTMLLLDPAGEYDLNWYEGDTLAVDDVRGAFERLPHDFAGFDLVVGNPPFDKAQSDKFDKRGGATLWHKFVQWSLKCLRRDGLLLFVHPSGWRKPSNKKSRFAGMFELMTKEHTMLELHIHNASEGKKIFVCNTRYDWYLILHCVNDNDTPTRITDEEKQTYDINLSSRRWLANKNLHVVDEIFARSPQHLLFFKGRNEFRRGNLRHERTESHNVPCLNSTKGGNNQFYYVDKLEDYNKCSKIIFTESINSFGGHKLLRVVKDVEGLISMTTNCIALNCEDLNIERAVLFLQSSKFIQAIDACMWGNFRIDRDLLLHVHNEIIESLK